MFLGLWRNGWAEFGQIGPCRVFAVVLPAQNGIGFRWEVIAQESAYESETVASGSAAVADDALAGCESAVKTYAMAALDDARARVIESEMVLSHLDRYVRDRMSRSQPSTEVV